MNDTQEKCGSRIDRHAVPGQGRIGIDALQRLIMHPRLKHIPVLMELPVIPLETEKKILDLVRTWDT